MFKSTASSTAYAL